jgi:hypothetical protein
MAYLLRPACRSDLMFAPMNIGVRQGQILKNRQTFGQPNFQKGRIQIPLGKSNFWTGKQEFSPAGKINLQCLSVSDLESHFHHKTDPPLGKLFALHQKSFFICV